MRKLIPVLLVLLFAACRKTDAVTPAKKEATRMSVRTADLRIIVADTSKTVEAVTKSVEAAGGYVSASQIWRDGELLRARVTLRVPAGRLTETLSAIRGLAKRVDNETIASSDVSEECVDLESQVRNLEATEAVTDFDRRRSRPTSNRRAPPSRGLRPHTRSFV